MVEIDGLLMSLCCAHGRYYKLHSIASRAHLAHWSVSANRYHPTQFSVQMPGTLFHANHVTPSAVGGDAMQQTVMRPNKAKGKATQMNNARQMLARSAIGLIGLSLVACASIIHGTHQDVGITSVPTGATVTIDNIRSGNSPVIAKLTRKDNHIVRIEMTGYQPIDLTLTRSVSGWVWGNVAFGGLIGLAVDAIDGGMYKLSPDQLAASLSATHASAQQVGDGVYLIAVLKPQSDWVKVAQLQAR